MHLANQDDYIRGVTMGKKEDYRHKYLRLAIVVIILIVILILMGYINPDYPPPAF